MDNQHLVNPDLQRMAFAAISGRLNKHAMAGPLVGVPIEGDDTVEKVGFIPAGDPSMDPNAAQQGGGGQPPPGGDPNAAVGGGAPPPPPAGDSGGGGGVDPAAIAQQVIQLLQAQGVGGGGGGGMGGGGMEPIKPKIDVNVTLMQILKILAKIADAMNIPIPASDMVQTQGDLTQFGMQQASGQDMPNAAGGQPQSAIAPIQPIQPAAPGLGAGGGGGGGPKTAAYNNGRGFDPVGMGRLGSKAEALLAVRRGRGRR